MNILLHGMNVYNTYIVSGVRQCPTGIPVAIPATAGIRGFAGIPLPAKFQCRDRDPYRDFTLNLVIKTC